jgi:hypothetical protein
VGYTYGYYAELNPVRARFALLAMGIQPPEVRNACELGFGQGMSVNIHAAASSAQWHATDFNPSQALFARELSGVSGSGAQLSDEAFAEFCARPDLPDFDYIGLHGIWTWISDENRAVIVDFVRRKLKLGGVLYASYNVLPGWSPAAPLRHLLYQHSRALSAEGTGVIPKVNAALEFADKLLATKPMYTRVVAGVAERLAKMKEHGRSYLAHEYFNRDWLPMYFADMARWLEPAKLSFAASAHLMDHVVAANLTAEQQKLLAEIPDAEFRETVRDYMVNAQFRRDYWVRGVRRLSSLEQAQAFRKLRLMLVVPRADVSMKATGSLGEITLNEAAHLPILDALADHRPLSIGELERRVQGGGMTLTALMRGVLMFLSKGDLVLVQDEPAAEAARAACERLNGWLLERARSNSDISFLASPVTGGGVMVNYVQQLFLLAGRAGCKSAEEVAAEVWRVLSAQGRRLTREGKTLETPEDNQAELERQAREFSDKRQRLLTSLGVS